jgi:hypothetical protein
VWFSHKILDTLKKKTVKSTELPDFSPIYYHAFRIFVNVNSSSLYKRKFVRQNFSGNLAENIWPELAALTTF